MKSQAKLFTRIVTGWVAVSVCVVATVLVIAVIYAAYKPLQNDPIANSEHVYGTNYASHKLLALSISGDIDGAAPSNPADRFVDTVYGYDIKQQLDDAAADDTVAGVILEINSPGGAIYGAQAIADGIKAYKAKTKKPVYAHVSGLAASGGYWVAAATDRITADLGSSVGSIGVIEGPFYYYDKVLSQDDGTGNVVTQNGIQSVTISAGRGKTEGDPYTKLTAEEIANLQSGVNDDYTAFVNFVSEHRKIPADTIRNTLGALIYGTQAATANKLIDATLGRDAAYAELAKAASLKDDDYEVIRPSDVVATDTSFASQALSFMHPKRAAKPTSAAKTASSSLCSTRGVKAYYGDPDAFCAK